MFPLLIALLPVLQVLPLVGPPSYVPERVYDTRQKAFSDFEVMLADLARADAVFIGEQHDDPNTHRLELAIVEGLARRGVPVIVSLEMFERDVQETLDRYTGGGISEQQFLKESRPWPRYATDYRPLVEFAKAGKRQVIASNVPRRIAADVSKKGLGAIDALGESRPLAARDLACPSSGSYFDRFAKAMGGHQGATANFYFAQCVKDETMGEAIADAFHKTTGRVTIVHVNGAFHSDFGEGAAESARRRMPGRRIAVVSVLPIADIDAIAPAGDDLKRADYLLFTVNGKR
jgi:uncharacterized iron-regulated protein